MMGSGGNSEKKTTEDKVAQEDSLIIRKPVNSTGTFLLYQLLRNYTITASLQKIQTSKNSELSDILPKTSENGLPNIYMSIVENQNLNYEDNKWLLEFVEEGNCAFIASDELYGTLKSTLFDYSYSVFNDNYYDTSVVLNFYHPNLKQDDPLTIRNGDLNSHGFPRYKTWGFFNNSNLNLDAIKIVYVSTPQFPVAVKLKYGAGYFIIHTIPPAFSNLNMMKESGKIHAETVLSHLPQGNIYWHQNFGNYSEYRGYTNPKRSSGNSGSDEPNTPRSSPLQFILKHPSLTIALILLMVGVLLYMIMGSKRRQRIIPPVESNENTSMEFVETVSKLYFQQRRHDKLIKHKEQILLSFIRHQYYISSPKVTEDFVKKVSEKSGIEEDKVKNIFISLKRGKTNRNISQKELIDLYNELEYFYKNCN